MQLEKNTITMNYDDFQELVKREVRLQMESTTKKSYPNNYPRNLFADLVPDKIGEINERHEVTKNVKLVSTNINGDEISESNYDQILKYGQSRWSDGKFDFREEVRMLTLAIFSESKNKDLNVLEWDKAQETYERLFELAYELYDERLSHLDEVGYKLPNERLK